MPQQSPAFRSQLNVDSSAATSLGTHLAAVCGAVVDNLVKLVLASSSFAAPRDQDPGWYFGLLFYRRVARLDFFVDSWPAGHLLVGLRGSFAFC